LRTPNAGRVGKIAFSSGLEVASSDALSSKICVHPPATTVILVSTTVRLRRNTHSSFRKNIYTAPFILRIVSKRSDMDSRSFTCKLHNACLSFVSVHQMVSPLTEVGLADIQSNIQLQLTNHLLIRSDERLCWPGWLTYSGRFTHLPTEMLTHPRQLQVVRRTRKVRQPKTDVLPLCHATSQFHQVCHDVGRCVKNGS